MAEHARQSNPATSSDQAIAAQVMTWPGVTAHDHRFGAVEFRVGNRQLGHLHGDRIAERLSDYRWRPGCC